MIGLVYCAQAGQERLCKMEVSRHKPESQLAMSQPPKTETEK